MPSVVDVGILREEVYSESMGILPREILKYVEVFYMPF